MTYGGASQGSFLVNIENSWNLGSRMCANGRCSGWGWGRQCVVVERTEDMASGGLVWNLALVLTHCRVFGSLFHHYISVWQSSLKKRVKSTFSGIVKIKRLLKYEYLACRRQHIYFSSLSFLLNKSLKLYSNIQVSWEMQPSPHLQESDPIACKWGP